MIKIDQEKGFRVLLASFDGASGPDLLEFTKKSTEHPVLLCTWLLHSCKPLKKNVDHWMKTFLKALQALGYRVSATKALLHLSEHIDMLLHRGMKENSFPRLYFSNSTSPHLTPTATQGNAVYCWLWTMEFSKMTKPHYARHRGYAVLEWTETEKNAIKALKKASVSLLVSEIPDITNTPHLSVDEAKDIA